MTLNLDLNWFSKQHWQKQPAHLPQLLCDFSDPIEPEELAGLAMEECIDSRIVTPSGTKHGPFEEFSALDKEKASLLVQAVNHWHQPCAQLFDQFRLLPNWRLDDLMVSYSTAGGSVGAHLDQYDVFIIQGQGKRRWRVGAPLTAEQAESFAHGSTFDAIINVEMNPGDALYIPPNTPHEGITLEPCLNYSVGFRAPSVSELLTRLADQLLDSGVTTPRFSDPDRILAPLTSGAIKGDDVKKLQEILCQYIQSEAGEALLLKQLSEQQREMDLIPAEVELSTQELYSQLLQGAQLHRIKGLIPIYREAKGSIDLYVQGQLFKFSPQDKTWVQRLCDSSSFALSETENNKISVEFLTILSRLVVNGFWYLD